MWLRILDISGSALSDSTKSQAHDTNFAFLFFVLAFIVVCIFITAIIIKHAKNLKKIKNLKTVLEEKQAEVKEKRSNFCDYCGSLLDETKNECVACGAKRVK